MNSKLIVIVLSTLTIFLGGFLIYEKAAFPIQYKVCNAVYADCVTIARFDDLNSCEGAKERASWYCDTITDPNKPDCHKEEKKISEAYCSE